ncbi:MAG: hypothetical protein ISS16_05990 [Ignavibacteria bacterium]|nr:hypothetical protein [Ignavibacteria bacterium]
MNKTAAFIFVLFFYCLNAFPQVENVPLSNKVYDFLKLMSVKKIIPSINDDDPNLSRRDVADFLSQIDSKSIELSNTEKKLLNKYKIEFVPRERNRENTSVMFDGKGKFLKRFGEIFTKKKKYLYALDKENNNLYVEGLGNLYISQEIKPNKKHTASLMDVGIRARGTLFNHLGYNISVLKGAVIGSKDLAVTTEPNIKTTFHIAAITEDINSYDFANGYVRYHTEPMEDMDLSVQLGREQLKYGFGYSDRLALSGNNPNMDFIKFKFKYGVINYSSITASTVGEFKQIRNDRYTKYFAANRLKLSFPDVLDFGIGESVIYSSRGIELAYLNPLVFYKFVEMSLQDRDNATVFFDVQTHFLKNLEFQGTFFLDENILFNLSELDQYINKTAYQIGAYVYEPANIENLSFILEYTRIRPYVYTHFDPKNTYTAFGVILGHEIGPNADQLYTKLAYNFSEWVSLSMEYQKIRKGNNIVDANGNLIRNVGGDVFQVHREGIDSDEAIFLDGERVNTDYVLIKLSVEPIRDFIFDFNYVYRIDNNITNGFKTDFSYAFLRMNIEY